MKNKMAALQISVDEATEESKLKLRSDTERRKQVFDCRHLNFVFYKKCSDEHRPRSTDC
jgi:hypothetical protein